MKRSDQLRGWRQGHVTLVVPLSPSLAVASNSSTTTIGFTSETFKGASPVVISAVNG